MDAIKIDDIAEIKFLSNVKYSPDGKHVCFAVHQGDLEENTYNSNLWLSTVQDDCYFQLTSFNEESLFIWLNDNQHILFAGTRDQKAEAQRKAGEVLTQFYRINIHGGEARHMFTVPQKVKSIQEIDEDTYLITAIFDPYQPDVTGLSGEEKAKVLKAHRDNQDYEVLEEIPFWSNGAGFTSKKRTRLYLYHVKDDTLEALTGPSFDVKTVCLNSTKTQAVLVGTDYEGKMDISNDMYLCDLVSKSLTMVARDEVCMYSYADFMTDTSILYTGTDTKEYGRKKNHKFYVFDVTTGKHTCLTPDFDAEIGNTVGSDCRYGMTDGTQKKNGEYLYFVTTEGTSSYLNRITVNGEVERVIGDEGTVDQYDVHDGSIVWIGFRGLQLQELYRNENGADHPITKFNEHFHKEKNLSTPEPISVETDPDVIIDGWVMKPVDFEEGKTYPAILDIHGGPKSVYSNNFFHEMQYWANQGYAVFFCNPRGGSGKGNAFADIRGKFGDIDYKDIMMFTDKVLETCSFIDPERIGVTGGSYGGYMTNWIIGQTGRFKAAVSQRSIANWISKFCTTDIGYYFVADQQAATPWGDYEKLWAQSPLKYAHNAKTPTLFIHSEQDYRCWLAEGLQMFTALKYHGVDARLCMFRGESHELSRSGKPKHRIRRLKEITEWFDNYLKN